MLTIVAIFAVLVLALWLYAALAIGVLLVNWGAPAAAAFAAFVYASRLGADATVTLLAAFAAFVAVRIAIVRVLQLLSWLWAAMVPPSPLRADAS